MGEHVTQGVYDYSRVKLCELYDSEAQSKGQAYDICYTNETSGWQEISFALPYYVDGIKNWRWDYVKNERLIRYKDDRRTEWFVVKTPKQSHRTRSISTAIVCGHLSENLKTKNLYLTFDDENGIGKIQDLAKIILSGTGWELGNHDLFYEADGTTEKVRSLKSEGKRGSYQLLQDLCSLFHGYPVFDSDNKLVHLYSLKRRSSQLELNIGKNLDSIETTYSSTDVVTRLYVEGEYGDQGYVGIDDVNPTGLPFLLNFDYYKEIGLYRDEHESAMQIYLKDMADAKKIATSATTNLNNIENELNELWGQPDYCQYVMENGTVKKHILGGEAEEEDKEFSAGDVVVVVHADETYTIHTLTGNSVGYDQTDLYMIKYITRAAGVVGGKEVAIEAKEEMIAKLEKEIEENFEIYSEEQLEERRARIDSLYNEVAEIYSQENGLYDSIMKVVKQVESTQSYSTLYGYAMNKQNEAEKIFAQTMGDMLKDGYWPNENYTAGQEESLYADALEIMEDLSRPSVAYNLGVVLLRGVGGYEREYFDQNTSVRVYDEALGINDFVYVNKTYEYPEDRRKDRVDVSNEYINMHGKTFESVLNRITQLADILSVKKSIYERADAISANGSIPAMRLEGTIDVQKTKLSAAVSNWYTDKNGNIIFESVTGTSAMMLCGEGFMIANGRTESGSWNWRTFGTGEGFTADAIISGFLSADRIEANTITANKLASDVGETLDLSSNTSIKLTVQNGVDSAIGVRVEIYSEKGDVLSEYVPETVLKAKVWRGNVDITDSIDASSFSWKRESLDSNADLIWAAAHVGVKEVALTTADVLFSATFFCEVKAGEDEGQEE